MVGTVQGELQVSEDLPAGERDVGAGEIGRRYVVRELSFVSPKGHHVGIGMSVIHGMLTRPLEDDDQLAGARLQYRCRTLRNVAALPQ
jgi:hypothetical protein